MNFLITQATILVRVSELLENSVLLVGELAVSLVRCHEMRLQLLDRRSVWYPLGWVVCEKQLSRENRAAEYPSSRK